MKLISGFPTGILGLLFLLAGFSFSSPAWAAAPTAGELKKLTANIHPLAGA